MIHSLLEDSTEKTCIAYVSSSYDNQVLVMHECLTTITRTCPFLLWRQNKCTGFLRQIKRSNRDPVISRSCFKFGDYIYKECHVYS